eukprot:CAMPEP_0170510318 /NCGR_PEP_ID=MMETSP0208-20121228/65700_1 /TAXON_ID=197538 /ORGANISM="Strombidium inclinatum, Strain S3" /LENGTH=182 /DNA_ID=CAMNT_0010793769 /DNA_START=778 /DNA_END=1325 /DNA_ORIENTATION=+
MSPPKKAADHLANVEAQPDALRVQFLSCVKVAKQLEQLALVFLLDAYASVLNRDVHTTKGCLSISWQQPAVDEDEAAGRSELEGVGDEVNEDLLQPLFVRADMIVWGVVFSWETIELDLDGDAHLLGLVLLDSEDFGDSLAGIEDSGDLAELALLELGVVEHVVDLEGEELCGAMVDAVASL